MNFKLSTPIFPSLSASFLVFSALLWLAPASPGNDTGMTGLTQVAEDHAATSNNFSASSAPHITCPPPIAVECNQETECITFNHLTTGSIVSSVTTGIGQVAVFGTNANLPGSNAAMIFDSANPMGTDDDLGSPHQDFGGPGIGVGGAAGQTFQNDKSLRKVLIVSTDLNGATPDDEADDGSEISLEFPQAVTLEHMNVLDIDPNQTNGYIRLFGAGNTVLATIALSVTGDNGLELVNLGPTAGVTRLVFHPDGSGAIDNICFTTGTPYGFPTATNPCQDDLSFSFVDAVTPGNCPQAYRINRTWTVRDACGQSSSCTQMIHVVDNTPPQITTPPDLTIECDEVRECITFEEFNTGDIVGSITTEVGVVAVNATNPTLGAGNAAMIFDSALPSGNDDDLGAPHTDFGGPGVGVGGEAGRAYQNDRALGKVLIISTDLDGSDPDDEADDEGVFTLDFPVPVTLEHMNVMDIDPNQPKARIRLYGAGNALLTTIPLAISGDNGLALVNLGPTAGVLRMEVELDGSGALDNICYTTGTPLGFATATDNCTPEMAFSFVDAITPGACPQEFTITRTWTARDACGNPASAHQTINIVDTTPPVINPPAMDLTVECDGMGNTTVLNNWLATNGGAMATDNCGNVTWSNDFTGLSDDCGATGSATVTFTATDECGNPSTTTATFTIEDTTPPSIDMAAMDRTVECDGMGNMAELNAWLASNGGAVASDICGGVMWSNDFTGLSDDCGATGSATVTFTATDECGNPSTTTATFTIEDTTPPSIDMAAMDRTVECDGMGNTAELNAWLASNGGAVASDICGGVMWSNDFTGLSDDCGATGSATVTFTATDECGNPSTTTATFTIEDTTPPSIDMAAMDRTVECDGMGNMAELNAWLASNGGAVASDICGGVMWSNDFTGLSDDCGATGSATVTFTATDECGNPSTTTATFTIEDTTPPSIDMAAMDRTVECDGMGNMAELNAWLASNGGAVASDICGGVMWSNDFTGLSDDCGATGSATVTFTATDECGNPSTTTATFTIEDTTPPSIDMAAMDRTVECDGMGNMAELNAWLASNGGAVASDICGGVMWSNDFTGLSDDCGATGSATVTFTATDECGNPSTTTATFTIEDTTPPSIDMAAMDRTVECDGMGNTAELNAWLASNGGAVASDICGGVMWSNDFTGLSDDCGATGSATVTFTATDECGNPSTTTATFTIEDTTPPSIDMAAMDRTVECDGMGNMAELNAWLASNGGAVASDICGGVMWSNDFTGLSDDCGATGSATVTFTATDECGNPSTTTATFTIEDTTPPSIDMAAMDRTVECDGLGNTAELNAWLASNGGAVASDICGGVMWSNDFTGLSDDCGATGSATVTFTATDECGNPSTTTATFTIEDTTPPSIDMAAMDRTVECDGMGNTAELNAWLASNGGAVASDICGGVMWSNDFTGLSDDCGATGSATVTFTATDECGNPSTTTATFTIEDTTPPSIDMAAMDRTVECDGMGNMAELNAWLASNGGAMASDICSGVAWSNNFSGLSDGCGATGSATVTFTAMDKCGNPSTTTATFTIEDTQAPVGTAPAGETGLASLADVPAPDPDGVAANFSDDCGSVSAELFFSYTAGTDCGTFNVHYIYDVFDECGNTVQAEVVHSGNNPNQLTGLCPEGNKKLFCLAQVPDPDEDWVASHYTGNGPITATLVDIIEMGDECVGFSVVHEYEVTDGCATLICKVRWEGKDDRRPTGSCPVGLTGLVCIDDIPAPDPVGIAAGYTDGCGPVTATLINTIDDTDDCLNFSRTYEYEIADPCGNAVYCSVTHSGLGKTCPGCLGSDDDGDLPGDDGDTDTPGDDEPGDGGGRPGRGRNAIQPGGTAPNLIGGMRLHPNPTSGQLTITLEEATAPEGEIFVVIQDLYGRSIYVSQVDRNDFTGVLQLNLEELNVATGTYIVTIRTNQATYSQKLLVNRL